MTTFILKIGTLNDDELFIASPGKQFSGGYYAIIQFWTFATCWSNHKHYKRFKSEKTLLAYLAKHYPTFEFYTNY